MLYLGTLFQASGTTGLCPGVTVRIEPPRGRQWIRTCRPPPPSRTKWTRRVPHPVLIGHAASLTQVGGGRRTPGGGAGPAERESVLAAPGARLTAPALQPGLAPPPGHGRPPPTHTRTKWTRRVPHLVLIGHAASFTPQVGTLLTSVCRDELAVHPPPSRPSLIEPRRIVQDSERQ